MKRILIVDDHWMIRKGLIQMLTELGKSYEADEADCASQTLHALRTQPYDAVLLDIALGDRDGFDVLRSIRSEFPRLGVVMLSVYPESQFAVRALRSGAHAYLNKGCDPVELDKALQKACAGQVYVTGETANLLAFDIRKPHEQAPHQRLSTREMQVMLGLTRGQCVSDLAEVLCLSANTISTYRARVFEKLGVKNLVELLNYVRQHQLDPHDQAAVPKP